MGSTLRAKPRRTGAADLSAVQGGFDEGGHHSAKGADVVEVGAHPVPDGLVNVRVASSFFSLMVFSSAFTAT